MSAKNTDESQYVVDLMRTYVKHNYVKVKTCILTAILQKQSKYFVNDVLMYFENYLKEYSILGQHIFTINGYG